MAHNTPLRDPQPLTLIRPRFLQPPSLDNSQDHLDDTAHDKAIHPRSFHYTHLPEHVQTPQSAELTHRIDQVMATSANTVLDHRGTTHTSPVDDSPLGQTRLLAPSLTPTDPVSGRQWGGWVNGHVSNLTHIDPFSGGGWGGRVTGHELTLPSHTATRQHHRDAIDRHHPQPHHSRSSFVSDSIPTSFSTGFSPPGSDPTLSPDQFRKKRASACTGGQGEDHIGHTHTDSTRHAPDNNDRHESRTNPGDDDKAATPAAMLMEGETAQSLLSLAVFRRTHPYGPT